jgi:hypothetical protein
VVDRVVELGKLLLEMQMNKKMRPAMALVKSPEILRIFTRLSSRTSRKVSLTPYLASYLDLNYYNSKSSPWKIVDQFFDRHLTFTLI